MRFVFYTHSLISDWNHGNAHFLRGVMRDLIARGHEALALEPQQSWSRDNLEREQGQSAIRRFHETFPELQTRIYDDDFEHGEALQAADVVVVHEWTNPALIAHIGHLRRELDFTLLFHDTHHRSVSAERDIADLMLEDYDGVLAFGETMRERYLRRGWGSQVFVWHEAADDRLFYPRPEIERRRDLVWIGNWGDGERSRELETFLIRPAAELGLQTTVHGVRYPGEARAQLSRNGIAYRGWLPNAEVPAVFASHRATIHVPRRPYVEALPGIPTIRPFEALACGIPLVSAPWQDSETLFRPGKDYLVARTGGEMAAHLNAILHDRELAAELAASGLQTIRSRHTCRHRVDELLTILARLRGLPADRRPAIQEAAE